MAEDEPWRWSEGRKVRRGILALIVGAVLSLIVGLWLISVLCCFGCSAWCFYWAIEGIRERKEWMRKRDARELRIRIAMKEREIEELDKEVTSTT